MFAKTYLGLGLLGLLLAPKTSHSQTPNWQPYGEVLSLAKDDTYLYLGGDFSLWHQKGSPNTLQSCAGFFDVHAKLRKPNEIKGLVNCSASDNQGGLFVGGNLEGLNQQPCSNLIYIDAQGQAQNLFPNMNGPVTSIAVSGNQLFVSGFFSHVDTFQRPYLVKFKRNFQGQWQVDDQWRPQVNNYVQKVVYQGNSLFILGIFNQVNQQNQASLAKLDGLTAALDTSWNPNPDLTPLDICAHPDGKLYVAGNFSRIANRNHASLARFDINQQMAFDVNYLAPSSLQVVVAIEPYQQELLVAAQYAGSDYILPLQANGQVNNSWRYRSGIGVRQMRVGADGKLYVVGNLEDQIEPWNHALRLNLPTGTLDSTWQALSSEPLRCLTTFADSSVFVGGDANYLGGVFTGSLARINLQTLELDTQYLPRPNGPIFDLETRGNRLYVGGKFYDIAGENTPFLAYLESDGRAVASFNSNVYAPVRSLRLFENHLYVAQVDSTLLRTDTLSGQRDASWHNLRFDGLVNRLYAHDNRLYVGGRFSNISQGVQIHFFSNLARLNAQGLIDASWHLSAGGPVHAFVAQQNQLYIGGEFVSFGQQNLLKLVQIDLSNDSILPAFSPSIAGGTNIGGGVYDLEIAGSYLYVVGRFIQPSISNYIAGFRRYALHDRTLDTTFQLFDPNIWAMPSAFSVKRLMITSNGIHIGGNLQSNYSPYSLASWQFFGFFPAALRREFTPQALRLWPNPSAGSLQLDLPDSEVWQWRLVDALGRQVQAGQTQDGRLDLRVSAGLYRLVLERGGRLLGPTAVQIID